MFTGRYAFLESLFVKFFNSVEATRYTRNTSCGPIQGGMRARWQQPESSTPETGGEGSGHKGDN